MVTMVFYIFNYDDEHNRDRVQEAYDLELLPTLLAMLRERSNNDHVVEYQAFAMNCVHSLTFYHADEVVRQSTVKIILEVKVWCDVSCLIGGCHC